MSQFRAKQRVENIDVNSDGSPGKRGFVVADGEIVEDGHPALALQPDAFEEVEVKDGEIAVVEKKEEEPSA